MHKKVVAPTLFSAAMVATLLLGGGVSVAAKTPKSLIAAGPHIPKSGGLVSLTAYQNNDGPMGAVFLTGAIGDYGKAVRNYANGIVVQQYNQLDVQVSHGSFQLKIAGLERSLVRAAGSLPTNLKSCSGTFIVHATTPVVSGSGTGAYKGISGSFKMTVTVNEVDSWPKCPRSGQTLIAESVYLTASGAVFLH
jgi:hypothetical protein